MIIFIRAIVLLSYFFVVALLGILVCLFRPFNPDNTRICGRMFSIGGIKILGIKMTIDGKEHLKNMQSSIVIANHQDNLDLFIHGGVIPKRTVSVGKKSLRYLPLFGQVYWLSGNIMIDRKKSKDSINTMTETTEALKNNSTSIWVFAEGTRNKGKNLLPFKKGAFHMAKQADAPILPICASAYPQHINFNKWHAGEVKVRILPPIQTKDLNKEDMNNLCQKVHDQMFQTIEALNSTIVSNK
ncbi:MAG: 1-acyl-sn-glycerol-3-phosphate acyltransferase [Oleiphilaceae bacterium]|jgi:1-acyl-sn-glycerol-3-phosphate acyltransferase